MVGCLGLSDEYIQTDPMHGTGTVTVGVDAEGQPSYQIADEVAWDFLEREEFNPLIRSARTVCFGTLCSARMRPGKRCIASWLLLVLSIEAPSAI